MDGHSQRTARALCDALVLAAALGAEPPVEGVSVELGGRGVRGRVRVRVRVCMRVRGGWRVCA